MTEDVKMIRTKTRTRCILKIAGVSTALLLAAAAAGFTPGRGPLAMILKVIPEVTKQSHSATDWAIASKGDPLTTGDKVRTDKNSLALIKFMDRSIVRLREQSVLTVDTSTVEGKFTKFIKLWKGGFGFEFRKQKDEQFRLTSPTAVASIRGTRGMLSGGDGSDTLIVTEGTVRFGNNVSNREVDVAAGNIGISSQDGTISSRRATTKELAEADRLATGGTLNELKLELRDKQGNKKELKLKYKQ